LALEISLGLSVSQTAAPLRQAKTIPCTVFTQHGTRNNFLDVKEQHNKSVAHPKIFRVPLQSCPENIRGCQQPLRTPRSTIRASSRPPARPANRPRKIDLSTSFATLTSCFYFVAANGIKTQKNAELMPFPNFLF
jgi:hypothetical protein